MAKIPFTDLDYVETVRTRVQESIGFGHERLEKLGETRDLLAKPDVDNVGAGRAAKGASPVASIKNNG